MAITSNGFGEVRPNCRVTNGWRGSAVVVHNRVRDGWVSRFGSLEVSIVQEIVIAEIRKAKCVPCLVYRHGIGTLWPPFSDVITVWHIVLHTRVETNVIRCVKGGVPGTPTIASSRSTV